MIETILTILLALVVAAVIWYFLKNVTSLIINAVVGVITLFIVQFLGLLGMENYQIGLVSILVCALGGFPGAVILIVLNALGIPIS